MEKPVSVTLQAAHIGMITQEGQDFATIGIDAEIDGAAIQMQ